jgi:hypothetical protein
MMQQAQTLAEMSGGQFFRVVGQADRFYRRVLTSASAIYRLGVELPKSPSADGNYTVAVTVTRPRVRVLASRYAAAPATKAALTPEEEMSHAITTGEPRYAIPVQMVAAVVPAKGSLPAGIRVSIDVPGTLSGPISGILGVIEPDGALKTSRHDLTRSGDGRTYIRDLLVPASPGTYVLRFAVVDASGAVGSIARIVVVDAVSAQPSPVHVQVQGRDVTPVLAMAAAYITSYEQAFSAVVSEEVYSQELRVPPSMDARPPNIGQLPPRFLGVSQAVARTLRADVLQTLVGQREWVAFRDVYQVDGTVVRDRDMRLQRLFIDAPLGAVDQARRILAESARYNIGKLQRDINVPTMALAYLRESNQSRSGFSVDGNETIAGVTAVVLEFKERATPTIVRSSDGDVPATGRAWIEPQSGRVLKTEILVASRRSGAKITVTYGLVPELKIWVPVVMTEEYTGAEIIFGKATYSKFRQFAVSTAIK